MKNEQKGLLWFKPELLGNVGKPQNRATLPHLS